MKKQVLFMAMVLIGLTSATATATGHVALNGEDYNNARYRFAEPIVFIERGVEFLIFPDGSFDFNTEINTNISDVYYRTSKSRRSSVNTTYGAPGTVSRIHYSRSSRPTGVIISHDSNGLVRRIGNVFINYDRDGRIKRAGSVYMSYQRGNGLLRQVGGLKVNYNRWGEIVHISGIVNHYNADLNCGLGSGYGGNQHDYYEYDGDFDDSFYYYRKDGKVKKIKKHKKA
ncbi:hypothetical protein [Psychroserpens algicola]|uniref:Uncharacterized protein n=1 Tax=Psychroserpens algicola TaxID=1719034 RepID=A0ABT0H935_9FLAO|nr:hypothetical protein [Psychroserpens algicola]MCK8480702.1 hypothetical protein [Psychroserpens algicola]